MSKSPRRDDCKSLSSFSSLLLELDIPPITQDKIYHRYLPITTVSEENFALKLRKLQRFSRLFHRKLLRKPPETSSAQPLPFFPLEPSPLLTVNFLNDIKHGVFSVVCNFAKNDFIAVFTGQGNVDERKWCRKGMHIIGFSVFNSLYLSVNNDSFRSHALAKLTSQAINY